ncbi:MAG: succinate dehydrogenase assembly factor 2 [Brevundimonas sp.]|uniref:FAD assembly factor SdhE n=1 Tax=Brevundimonas sp. TaxID=1871086 RepID=UPI003919073B
MADDDARLKRLRFRAWRRGFREADMIFGPFTDQHARAMSDEELDVLEHLLDAPDQELYAWVIGREPVPEAYLSPIMTRIQQFVREGGGVIGDE